MRQMAVLFVTGFELMTSGALYDSEGNLKEWWTNETMAQFTTRTRCVEEYYDGLTVNGLQVWSPAPVTCLI